MNLITGNSTFAGGATGVGGTLNVFLVEADPPIKNSPLPYPIIVTHHDYHATLLHLFGLDHTKLIYRRAGRELSLTDNKPARIVREILA